MKKSRSAVFRNLFYSYVIMVSIIFILMISILTGKDYISERQRIERRAELAAMQASLVLDNRISAIKAVVSRINTSTTIRSLYMNLLENQQILDAYTLQNIMTELKMLQVDAEQSGVEEIVIFINGYDKAYSGYGIVTFADPFIYRENIPQFSFNNIETLAGISDNKKFTLLKDTIIYCDSYTYASGSPKGLICVSLDLKQLEQDLKEAADGFPVRVLLNGETILGNKKGSPLVFFSDSQIIQGLSCEIDPDVGFFTVIQGISLHYLFLCVVLFAGFLTFSWHQAKKHYEPIKNIKKLVISENMPEPKRECDEINRVIEGIKELIVERNGYQKRLINIRPYVQNGMLHGLFSKNTENDMIKVLSEEEYLDLKKPFFSIAAVNIFEQKPALEAGDCVKDMFERIPELFSNGNQKVVCYRNDGNSCYLLINSDTVQAAEGFLFNVHRYMTDILKDFSCIVTFGVDEVKDSLELFGEAYEHAKEALEYMLLYGRGEIYFYEEKPQLSSMEVQYYFPKNSIMRLAKMIQEKKIEDIRDFLYQIYARNIELGNRMNISVQTLINEIHITIIKSLREVNELNTFQISLKRVQDNSTLQEAVSYYIAALEAIVERMQEDEKFTEDLSPDEKIADFIRKNCFNSEISLKMISDQFQVSNKYITIICKKFFGTTYLQYIHNKRIERAIFLLQTTDQSIEQIAQETGYGSPLTFRRNFQQVTGVNPSIYREEIKDKTTSPS